MKELEGEVRLLARDLSQGMGVQKVAGFGMVLVFWGC